MPRPLTAADRVPRIGDVMRDSDGDLVCIRDVKECLPDGNLLVVCIWKGIETPNIVFPNWVYDYRADGGSLTTEAE